MQINVCRKCIVFQNLALYYAALLKFEIYAFVCQSELFKAQVYAIKPIWKKHALSRVRLHNELCATNNYVII